ncbi:MAG: response regulator [Synechococcales bacterium]|nr:response regulator [Synechococcales bacterium]
MTHLNASFLNPVSNRVAHLAQSSLLPRHAAQSHLVEDCLAKLPLPPITAYYLQQLLAAYPLEPWVPAENQPKQPLMAIVRQLEQLTLQHQTLNSQGAKHHASLTETEVAIFQLLGVKNRPVKRSTILVVDDTLDVLRFFSEILTHHGYEACSAISGAIALNHATQIQPDLVLLDIMIPDIDGYEVCERLRADPGTAEIPIIVVSAIDEPLDKVKAFNLGASDYLTKPIQVEEMLIRIERQLTLRQLQQQMTDQNAALQQLVARQELADLPYRNFFDHAVDGMYFAGLDGQYQQVNPALAHLLGYESPDQMQQAIPNIAQHLYTSSSRWAELITYLQQYGVVSQFVSQVQGRSGQIVWICESVRLVRTSHQELWGLEGVVRLWDHGNACESGVA